MDFCLFHLKRGRNEKKEKQMKRSNLLRDVLDISSTSLNSRRYSLSQTGIAEGEDTQS